MASSDISDIVIFKKKLGLNYEKMKNKAILINNIRVGKYDEEKNKYIQKNIKMFEYKENETINCKTSDDKQFDVEIGIITEILGVLRFLYSFKS